jgi:hypothetical protein
MRMAPITILSLLATLVASAPAAAWTTPAALPGALGQQHISYPSFTDATHIAPLMTFGNVGDVNGDGREDVAAGFSGFAPSDDGTIYVTFSSPLASIGNVLGLDGFRITTPFFWFGLSSAGDVNGDGLGDIALLRGDQVTAVFGRIDGRAVDTRHLGDDGFTIAGAGRTIGNGFGGVMLNTGLAPLGDVNHDGVPDLLVAAGRGAAIIYPPRSAAGITIDAGVPGPYVSTIAADNEHALDAASVDVLGDIDHDGRTDVMVGGEEVHGTDQVVYGVATPEPGTAVSLPAAVEDGRAFSVRTHDGRDGWYGELEQARSVGDQNHDGIRDVAMLCGGCGGGGRQLRVVYSPPFGTVVDAGDLFASEPRGWSFHSYADTVDVGDQNGDGVGDIGDRSYVYFPDPEHEPGTHEPVFSGFYFAGGGEIVASLGDVNGDGRREIAIARIAIADNDSTDSSAGQSATYGVDIYDSATAPQIGLPDLPILGTGGELTVGVDVGSGAGTRADDLPVHPIVEVATPSGAPQRAADLGVLPGSDHDLHAAVATAGLVAGDAYRIRVTATNGRGQQADGPWRSFLYNPNARRQAVTLTPVGARATTAKAKAARPLGLGIRSTALRLRHGKIAVRVVCEDRRASCRGTLRLTSGRTALGSHRFAVAPGRHATVTVGLSGKVRRTLGHRRTARVVVTARTTRSGAAGPVSTAALTTRLR